LEDITDVVIVGGGVIGCAIAYYLSKQGVAVTLLERNEIGSQASGAATGMFALLKPMTKMDAYNQLLFASQKLFMPLIAELQAASGIDLEYEQTGTLRTIHHEVRIERLHPWIQSCQQQGLSVSLLDDSTTRQMEPLLTPADLYGAISFPDEGQINAARVVAALAHVARLQGAILRTHTEVTGIVSYPSDPSRVSAVQTSAGETIHCRHLVLAMGAWAAQCSEWFGVDLPVVPQRGQVIALHQPDPPIRHMLIGKGIYIAPKPGGIVIVGATKDDAGFDCRVTVEGIHWLLSSALQLVPSLAQSGIERFWAGLRPKTPDGHPILGSLPGWENVLLALGHFSFGILLSAITGSTIAELVTTGKTPEIIRPFALERFASSHTHKLDISSQGRLVGICTPEELGNLLRTGYFVDGKQRITIEEREGARFTKVHLWDDWDTRRSHAWASDITILLEVTRIDISSWYWYPN
jgi:glycine oxidase